MVIVIVIYTVWSSQLTKTSVLYYNCYCYYTYIGQTRVITRAQTASPKKKIDGIRHVSSPSNRKQNTATGKNNVVLFLVMYMYMLYFNFILGSIFDFPLFYIRYHI